MRNYQNLTTSIFIVLVGVFVAYYIMWYETPEECLTRLAGEHHRKEMQKRIDAGGPIPEEGFYYPEVVWGAMTPEEVTAGLKKILRPSIEDKDTHVELKEIFGKCRVKLPESNEQAQVINF